jgi:hypothetical protein
MDSFDQIVDRISATLWNLKPAGAVYLGKHEYDGIVPDVGDDAVDGQVRRLGVLRDRLFGFDGLGDEEELDRLQLGAAIDLARFEEEVLRVRRRNPMWFVYHLDVDTYLNRSYAPMALRAERIAALLEQAPRLLDEARRTLEPPIPAVMAEWGARSAAGLAGFFDEGLMRAVGDTGDRLAEARVAEAASAASAALRGFAAWVEGEAAPAGTGGFQIGAEGIERMVRESELLDTSLDDLAALGEADLEANLAAFRETAAQIDPAEPPRRVYEEYVAAETAPPDGLVAEAAGMLEGIRRFLVERDLITIPSEVRAVVAETPPHLRWAFAMMDTPGPYETEATEAYYYVTPPEPDWDGDRVRQWLRTLNRFVLEDISIHEAYPGHYVHFLHFAGAPTEVSRRTASYAFTEGWAHYTEQMMWEAGYRDGDPRFRLAQLTEALVRNCRFVCALRMHAGDMTVDDATRFFVENAHYEEVGARKEAERGAFDPGYLSYTLGKLEILRLREEERAAAGSRFALKSFHDRLLSRGAPPVGLMRRMMLRG